MWKSRVMWKEMTTNPSHYSQQGGNAENEELGTAKPSAGRGPGTEQESFRFTLDAGPRWIHIHLSASLGTSLPDSSWWQGSESNKWIFLLNVVCHIPLVPLGSPPYDVVRHRVMQQGWFHVTWQSNTAADFGINTCFQQLFHLLEVIS